MVAASQVAHKQHRRIWQVMAVDGGRDWLGRSKRFRGRVLEDLAGLVWHTSSQDASFARAVTWFKKNLNQLTKFA